MVLGLLDLNFRSAESDSILGCLFLKVVVNLSELICLLVAIMDRLGGAHCSD